MTEGFEAVKQPAAYEWDEMLDQVLKEEYENQSICHRCKERYVCLVCSESRNTCKDFVGMESLSDFIVVLQKEFEKLKEQVSHYKFLHDVVYANLEEAQKITQEQIKQRDLKDLTSFEKKLALSLSLVPPESEFWR